jgi:hypothetical protein
MKYGWFLCHTPRAFYDLSEWVTLFIFAKRRGVCLKQLYFQMLSAKRMLIVLGGGNWSLTSASRSGPALTIVIKRRSVSLELELGCKLTKRKDLACIEFNS